MVATNKVVVVSGINKLLVVASLETGELAMVVEAVGTVVTARVVIDVVSDITARLDLSSMIAVVVPAVGSEVVGKDMELAIKVLVGGDGGGDGEGKAVLVECSMDIIDLSSMIAVVVPAVGSEVVGKDIELAVKVLVGGEGGGDGERIAVLVESSMDVIATRVDVDKKGMIYDVLFPSSLPLPLASDSEIRIQLIIILNNAGTHSSPFIDSACTIFPS